MSDKSFDKKLETEVAVLFSGGEFLVPIKDLHKLVGKAVVPKARKDKNKFNDFLSRGKYLMTSKYEQKTVDDVQCYDISRPKS